MNTTDFIGSLGVLLILLAYILNVSNKIKSSSLYFILLNLVGASLACLASVIMRYWPFIILEGVWALVSLVSFIKLIRSKNHLTE